MSAKLTTFLEKIATLAGGFDITDEMIKVTKSFVSSMTKSKTEKVKKDPNAPKRPTNAYMIFSQEKRDEVKAKMAGASPTEITAKLAEMWREAKEKNTKVYKDYQAKLEVKKKSYESEKAEYDSSHPSEDTDDKKAKVKKAPSAYNMFCSANLKITKEKNPNLAQKELMGLVAAKWKALSDKEKEVWKNKAAVPATAKDANAKDANAKDANAKEANAKDANAKDANAKGVKKAPVVIKESKTEAISDSDEDIPPKKDTKSNTKTLKK